jgi:alpha-glucuronidase
MDERDLFYKIKLLNDSSIKWLYQRRINSQTGNIPKNNDVEKEWQNLKTIIHNAAYESLGKYKKHSKKKLHKWDKEIKKNIEQKTGIKQKVKHTKIRRLDII